MAKLAFLFPGQGAQAVGMGAELAAGGEAAQALFARASELLGYDLLQLCLEGPAERLDRTEVAQPALYVAGLAAAERFRLEAPDRFAACEGAAGLSLGEYTALAFAGAIGFEDGLKVVAERGAAMQAAADATPSGMVSVLGLDPEKLEAVVAEANAEGKAWLANFLCPGNTVVSGDLAGVAAVERLAAAAGAMKTIRLAVAGAFHTELMRPADARLAAALAEVPIKPPRVPVYSNVDGAAHADPEAIRAMLVRQVLEPVRWEQSMRAMLADGFDAFQELGPGRVLAGLLKRIHRRAEVGNLAV